MVEPHLGEHNNQKRPTLERYVEKNRNALATYNAEDGEDSTEVDTNLKAVYDSGSFNPQLFGGIIKAHKKSKSAAEEESKSPTQPSANYEMKDETIDTSRLSFGENLLLWFLSSASEGWLPP